METNKFDMRVRELLYNPHFIEGIDSYDSTDIYETRFRFLGYNQLSINTAKVLTFLCAINDIMKDPSESIEWFLRKLSITTDLTGCNDIHSLNDLTGFIKDFLDTDRDEETGAYWLFENRKQEITFINKCKDILKYSDLLLIAQAYDFDIVSTAEFFSGVVLNDPIFFYEYEKVDDIDMDEVASIYYRPVYAAVIYFWLLSKKIIPTYTYFKNENKDNYKSSL